MTNYAEEIRKIATEDLDWNTETKDFDTILRHPTVIERDGRVFVSAEDGCYFADYYGEYRGGYPWIHPELEKFAKERGGYWEWENPGCIYLVVD